MKKVHIFFILFLAFISIVGLSSCAKKEMKTLTDLQAAYQDEKNDMAIYISFAKIAESDNLPDAAKLFKALAKAEEIHSKVLGKAIKELGAEPKFTPVTNIGKTTKENLEYAIKNETADKEQIYAPLLTLAENEEVKQAIRAIRETKSVENQNGILIKNALENFESLNSGNAEYYVCSVCGFPVRKINFGFCPICMNPKDVYIKIE